MCVYLESVEGILPALMCLIVCFLLNVSAPPAVWSHAAAEGEGQTHRPEAAVSRLLRSLRPPVLLRERPGCLQKTPSGETHPA